MSDRLVLVDTSAWLAVFRAHGLKAEVDTLQAANRIAINWLIRAELLAGAKDDQDYGRLNDELHGLHQLDLRDDVWQEAARLRFRLRRRGLLLPLADTTIAGCAMVYDCELLHADRHFDVIARATPLKIFHAAR